MTPQRRSNSNRFAKAEFSHTLRFGTEFEYGSLREFKFNPDYSRCVGVDMEKACFDRGIVPSLWFRQFTHDVNW
jgi:hypothetical protein